MIRGEIATQHCTAEDTSVNISFETHLNSNWTLGNINNQTELFYEAIGITVHYTAINSGTLTVNTSSLPSSIRSVDVVCRTHQITTGTTVITIVDGKYTL